MVLNLRKNDCKKAVVIPKIWFTTALVFCPISKILELKIEVYVKSFLDLNFKAEPLKFLGT